MGRFESESAHLHLKNVLISIEFSQFKSLIAL